MKNKLIHGFLLVNKHQGPSSNSVLQQVRKLYNADKAGHTGSLDPLATGMLPIAFGEATKFSQYALNANKVYLATGLFGIKTDTADSLGKVIDIKTDFKLEEYNLRAALDTFIGETQQAPSMFSALKYRGKPL